LIKYHVRSRNKLLLILHYLLIVSMLIHVFVNDSIQYNPTTFQWMISYERIIETHHICTYHTYINL